MNTYSQLRQKLLQTAGIPVEYDNTLDSTGLADWRATPKIVLKAENVPAYVIAHEAGHLRAKDTLKHKLNDLEGSIGNLALSIHATDVARKLIKDAMLRKERLANQYGLYLLQEIGANPRYINTAIKEYDRYLDRVLTEQGDKNDKNL